MRLEAGLPYPFGATPRDGGVNFAVFSAHATSIELCLYDPTGRTEQARVALPSRSHDVWHGFLPGASPGLVYGLRAHGPYAPQDGHRFNANKLLIDPYARELFGRLRIVDEQRGYSADHPDRDRALDPRDDAAVVPKARVAAPLPPLGQPRPQRAMADTVLYELHVKGWSQRSAAVPPPLRGRYAGLGHEASVAHLQRLGITAVSLLPVHACLTESRLEALGLANYWGYNTIGYFCPDPRLSCTPVDPSQTRAEFRAMVESLHAAGIEVILDVVYNHSAESDETGPTLSFRGLDNASYYHLAPDDRSRYENWAGCGNVVNVGHPRVTQLVLDSLRYWHDEMGVDGFRFDLASVLGRKSLNGFDPQAPFFVALEQDPALAGAKLIAEPWDIGPGGYQLGRYPGRWAEWNDRFRDGARLFWISRGVSRGEFARRVTASSDKFQHGSRTPSASVNFVTSHDGFTLTDLVSYSHKHNHANGEHNRDGHHANFSTNCGIEGSTTDPAVLTLRGRLKRALLATTLLAQGTPMLQAGDEFGRTQRGNNNAYCQDNPIGWIDWSDVDEALMRFTAAAVAIRREHALLRQDRWLHDGVRADDGGRDVEWLAPHGGAMTVGDWNDGSRHAFGELLAGRLLLVYNAEPADVAFALPDGRWRVLLDSAAGTAEPRDVIGPSVDAPAHGLLVLERTAIPAEPAR